MACMVSGNREQITPERRPRDNEPRGALPLLKQAFTDWKEDHAPRLSAALSFYTALSIAPLLVIAIAVAGLAFGQEAARGEVLGELGSLVGPASAATLESMVQSAAKPRTGMISTIIGAVLLLLSASGVFGELQNSLNTIWEVKPQAGRGLWRIVRQRFLSMTMVLGVGFLLLVALLISAALAAFGKWLEGSLPGGPAIWQMLTFVVSFAMISLLFAMIFKILPDVTIAWRDVWIGAVATALLFNVGKLLIGLYLGRASFTSSYGAAASLVVFLLWVYYSTQILFFGAELTQAYARMYGSRIQPARGAVPMDEPRHEHDAHSTHAQAV